MTEVVKLDAVGTPIEMGATYGYSDRTNTTIGKVTKITKTGKVTLEVTSRKSFMYGELCDDGPWSRIESPTVSVFSHILFKISEGA